MTKFTKLLRPLNGRYSGPDIWINKDLVASVVDNSELVENLPPAALFLSASQRPPLAPWANSVTLDRLSLPKAGTPTHVNGRIQINPGLIGAIMSDPVDPRNSYIMILGDTSGLLSDLIASPVRIQATLKEVAEQLEIKLVEALD